MTRSATVFLALAALTLVHCSSKPKKARLTPEEVEQICVYVVSCTHEGNPDSEATVSECVNDLMWIGLEAQTIDHSDIVSCMVDAGSDCERLWRCGNEGHSLESCDPATFTDRCDGTMMVLCSEGTVVYYDCSRFDALYGDATCEVDADSGDLDCVGSVTCEGFTSVCQGDVVEMCIDGEFMRLDCSLVGADCRQLMPGYDSCIGRGDACTGESTWCEGTSVMRCLGGHEAAFDCARRLGSEFTCIVDTDGEADCGPAGTQCDGETHVDTCSGTSISYCRWGFSDSVDCTLLDYSACTEGTSSAFCE
jgi:hypothetical protein